MSYTFNLESLDFDERQIAAVRDETDDRTNKAERDAEEGTDYFLSDERIKRRLRKERKPGRSDEHTEMLASASALDTLATNQAYVLKVGSTLGESRNGASVADSIRKHAASLRATVKEEVEAVESAMEETAQASSHASQSVANVVGW